MVLFFFFPYIMIHFNVQYQFFWTSFRDMVLCDFQRGSMLIPPKGKRMVSRQEHLTSASNKSDFSYLILSDCLSFFFLLTKNHIQPRTSVALYIFRIFLVHASDTIWGILTWIIMENPFLCVITYKFALISFLISSISVVFRVRC